MNYLLILNSGSTSVQYSLFDRDLELLQQGRKERIGLEGGVEDHSTAVEQALEEITEGSVSEENIKAVGHRVVHGGKNRSPVVIDNEIVEQLKEYNKLAPLHNPHNLSGIEAGRKLLPQTEQVACFDTSFYSELEKKNVIYPVPHQLYEEHGIKRYGFHGLSHQMTMERIQQTFEQADKIITAHLGGGASVTAVEDGKPVHTSMGFTPLEGLMMTTRCGDIDPALVPYLVEELDYDLEQVKKMMNEKSGLLGMCGARDFRVVLDRKEQNERMQLAFDKFCQSIVKYVGYYVALLNGVDAIAFTGAIGKNSGEVRKEVINHLGFMGASLDQKKNNNNELVVSGPDSEVKVMAVPANEELNIARKTKALVFN